MGLTAELSLQDVSRAERDKRELERRRLEYTEEEYNRMIAYQNGDTPKVKPVSMSDIFDIQEEREWFLDELITPGICSVSAKKGNWKSLFALGAGYAIASGKPFLNRATIKCKVLYAALELDKLAMSERCKRLGKPPEGFDAVFNLGRDLECLDNLEYLLSKCEYRVVFIDMIGAVLPDNLIQNEYNASNNFMLKLRRLAQRHKAAIVCLTHSPKSTASDFADSVIGSTAFAGQSDSIIVLERKRGENNGTLKATGNHGRDTSIVISLDPETLQLTTSGDASFVSGDQARVIDTLKESPEPMSISQIAEKIGKSYDATNKLLKRMLDHGLIERLNRGKFSNHHGQEKLNL